MKRIVIVMVVGAYGVAAADDYATHIAAGNAAEGKRKWADALAQFEAALKAKPNDAAALAEIGWAAFNAGNRTRAKTASEAALAATTDFALRGAAFYNLGLATEADDRFAAASLVFAGYSIRPNATVEATLIGMQKKLAQTTLACANKQRDPAVARQKCALVATAAGKKVLERVKVDSLPLPKLPLDFHAPIDDVLVAALGKMGGTFQGIGMSKEELDITEVTCTESTKATPHTYECTAPNMKPVKDEVARAIVTNLEARKLAGKVQGDHTKYTAKVRCRIYDEVDSGTDLSCTVE